MKKRSKTKSAAKEEKKSAHPVRAKKIRARKYESHYLAIVLVAFLLLEGTLISSTHATDWQKGLQVLDISSAVSQTQQDLAAVFSPVTTTIDNVNQFYTLATDQMTQILDLSNTDPIGQISLVADGVNQFYQKAATQMAQLLDISSLSPWPSQVAGVSIQLR